MESSETVAVPPTEETYPFRNARAVQRARLDALESLLDPGTIDQLEGVGVGPGWRCLEVGAGGGSIAAYLCARTGRGGTVVATDLDVTVLGELSLPNLEVVRHDVQSEEPPPGPYDLIHMRLLLAWLRDPGAALQRLAGALRPGGWLVAEEMDFGSVVCDPRLEPAERARFGRIVEAHNAALAAQHAFDPAYGRCVVGELVAAGLTDVAGASRGAMWRGGETGGTVWRLTLEQLREPLLATGLVSAADVDGAIAQCADPGFGFVSPITMAARGRRPAAG